MKDLPSPAQTPSKGTVAPSALPSFRALYDAEVGYVGRVLLRFGVPRADLDDLLQEVFVVVYRRRADFDASRPVRPWLCGIAFRVASDWRRRAFQRERGGVDIHDVNDKDIVSGLPAADDRLAAHDLVQQALATLGFDHRAAIVLCDLEGHSAADAATLLGVPAGTVYSRLHHARAHFVQAVHALGAPP